MDLSKKIEAAIPDNSGGYVTIPVCVLEEWVACAKQLESSRDTWRTIGESYGEFVERIK
jgi:hypothetical protein